MVASYFDQATGRMGHLSKHQLYQITMDVDGELRAAWKAALKDRYGDFSAKDVDLHARYRSSYANIRHDVSYLSRGVVEDVYKYVMSAKEPEAWDEAWVKRMMFRPKYERRLVRFGWLDNSVRDKRMMSLRLPSADCKHVHFHRKCVKVVPNVKGRFTLSELKGRTKAERYDEFVRICADSGRAFKLEVPCGCERYRALPKRKLWDAERRAVHCPWCAAEGIDSIMDDVEGAALMEIGECREKGLALLSRISTTPYR
jgi:hypothetical protein